MCNLQYMEGRNTGEKDRVRKKKGKAKCKKM